MVPGWGPEPARQPRLHGPGTHFRARVYTTRTGQVRDEGRGPWVREETGFPSPQYRSRVSGKLKIERNVQIRPARLGGRSPGAGRCPLPYTLWEAGPESLSPQKISLGPFVSVDRTAQRQGRPQGAPLLCAVSLALLEASVSLLGNPRLTSDIWIQHPNAAWTFHSGLCAPGIPPFLPLEGI